MASDGEISDLTEVESDDYIETKTKKKSTAANTGKPSYKIKNALKVPRATTYTAQALYEQIHSCDINLEPEYQRDVVWPETKQIGIIDSVFRNFYIPPVIFAVNTYEDGSETKTCIDGKQRLTSIHKFMDGLIPRKHYLQYSSRSLTCICLTGEKLWYKDVQTVERSSRHRRLLPDEYRKTFANKQIVCVEYQDITDSDEREIFQRVQLGMALTPSEKLQVINSPRASFIRELQTTYLKEDGWLGGDALEWDRSRGSDFRCLSQAIYCMEKISGNLKGVTMVQLEKWLNLQDPFPPDFRAKILDAYRIFAELVQDPKLNKVFKKPAKVSPVEFMTIGLLVGVHKDTLTMAQLSAAIAKMREDVRAAYVDIRMNSRVMKTMIDFIKSLKMAKIPGDTGGPAGATGSTAGLKRKRAEQQSESEEGEEKDDNEKRGKQGDQKPKPKKNSTTTSNAKSSGSGPVAPTPKASLPSRVKAEPGPSPVVPTQVPKPSPPDRMAALRRAKATVTQQQQQYSALPAVPPALSNAPSSFPEFGLPNPQMLPSPGQSFSVLSSQTGPSNLSHPNQASNQNSYRQNQNNNMNAGNYNTGLNTTLPPPPAPPSQNAIETSLMASMMRSTSGTAPPPSASVGSTSSRQDSEGGSFRDREREQRDKDRDRNFGPPNASGSGGGGGRYQDDERHGSYRRDSGYGRRSPDETRRGRTKGWWA
ncbi:hypothetical protein BYT27DRAFT_7188278 [Phlegmacium glaucopus]|nr:hypothetical protein BYT27DRAFT_7188278 [Phlegmacium glaucopus]